MTRSRASVSAAEIGPPLRTQSIALGMGWMLLAAFLVAGAALMAKLAGGRLSPWQTASIRWVVGLIMLVPFMATRDWSSLMPRRFAMHLVRALLLTAYLVLMLVAVAHLPLADATALLFVRPLFVVVLACLILGEVIGRGRAVAALMGFAGVLILCAPNLQGGGLWAILAGLGAALASAITAIHTRQILGRDSILVFLLWANLLGLAYTAGPAAALWIWPTALEWLWLAAFGVGGMAAQLAMTLAFAKAEVSAVGPLDYTQLVHAALLGFLVFGTVPDWNTWAGAGAIAAAGIWLMLSERHRKRTASPLTEPEQR